MNFPEHPLWDFSISVYRLEGVAAACLNLQERHSIDINLLLFCLWLGHSGRGALSEDEVLAVMAASDRWHRKIVKALRFVRRTLKDGFEQAPEALRQRLRAEVQAAELDAEHLEQFILAAAVERTVTIEDAPIEARAADAAASVGRYIRTQDLHFEPRDAVDFAHILGKAFPGLKPDTALDLAEGLM